MQRACDACGVMYEAKTKRSRYHSPTCRQRSKRTKGPTLVVAELLPLGKVEAAAIKELDAAGRLDTLSGQASVTLARRVDESNRDTGSAVASMVRELRASMAEALANAERAADPVDELRARRAQRLA